MISLGFAETQRELVGLAADGGVEDIGRTRIFGPRIEAAPGIQRTSGLGQRRDPRRLVDAVPASAQRRPPSVAGAVVDDDQLPAGFQPRAQRRARLVAGPLREG